MCATVANYNVVRCFGDEKLRFLWGNLLPINYGAICHRAGKDIFSGEPLLITLDMINFKVDGTVKNVMSRSITSTSSTTMFIGKSPVNSSPPYINGYIAEIVMYDRGLTDAEVKQVECYLWHKYNINCAECSY